MVQTGKETTTTDTVTGASLGLKHLVLETKNIPALQKLDQAKWKSVSLITDTKDKNKQYLLTNHQHKGSFGKMRYAMALKGSNDLMAVKVFRLSKKPGAKTAVSNEYDFKFEKEIMEKAGVAARFTDVIETAVDKKNNPKRTLFGFLPLMDCDFAKLRGLPDIPDEEKKHVINYILSEIARDLEKLHTVRYKRVLHPHEEKQLGPRDKPKEDSFIHFDIKPSNAMAGKDRAALIDYGMAQEMGKFLEAKQPLGGTPEYYHPALFYDQDKFTNDSDREWISTIDVYAVALMCAELLSKEENKNFNGSNFWPAKKDIAKLPSPKLSRWLKEKKEQMENYLRYVDKWVKDTKKVCDDAMTKIEKLETPSKDEQQQLSDKIGFRWPLPEKEPVTNAVKDNLKQLINEAFTGKKKEHEDRVKDYKRNLERIVMCAKIHYFLANFMKYRYELLKYKKKLKDPKGNRTDKKEVNREWKSSEWNAWFVTMKKQKKLVCVRKLADSIKTLKNIDPGFVDKVLSFSANMKRFDHTELSEYVKDRGKSGKVDLQKGKKLLNEQIKKLGIGKEHEAARELLLKAREEVEKKQRPVISVPKVTSPPRIITSSKKDLPSQSGGGLLHDKRRLEQSRKEKKDFHEALSGYLCGVYNLAMFYQRRPSNAKLEKLHAALWDWYRNMRDKKEYTHKKAFAKELYDDVLKQAKKDKVKKILSYVDKDNLIFAEL